MKRLVILSAVLGVVFVSSNAWAEDVYDPPWTRGSPGTTLQWWEFSTDANPTDPEPGYNNTAGIPQVSLTGGFMENTVWYDEYYGHYGVWCFEEDMIASIPNFEQMNPVKEIWLQLTYWSDGIPNIFVLPEGLNPEPMSMVNNTGGGSDWGQATYYAQIEPNPFFEEIWIRPVHCTLYVDELVVDTICTVPEPVTICLLGLGALALLRKRRA